MQPPGTPNIAVAAGLAFLLAAQVAAAQTALDEDSPWPRVRSTNGNAVTLYLPQVERWTSNWFVARAVVAVKPAAAKKESLGVVWFEAHGSVDHSNRVVTLDRMEITKGRFPETTDNGSNALRIVREVYPAGARTVSLDYLVTALGFARAGAREGAPGLNHTPPEIIWVTNRTVVVLVDGEPVLRPIPNSSLERVINTPVLLARDKTNGRFYLSGNGRWFAANSLEGPWSLLQTAPPEVAALSAPSTNAPPATPGEPAPRIIVSTRPAELLTTDGAPDFRPIRGTALQYAADSDSQLFFHSTERTAYLLLSGRWFKAASLQGPWTYVSPHDLPEDFAKIPPGSPQAIVLSSVPDTQPAELALLAASVPTTATVDRHTAKLEVTYDGEPNFKAIEGTEMSYAINAPVAVIHSGTNYYAVEDGVWFAAPSARGPWEVAVEVPEEIYTIPPSSPVYYATFARVYDADDNNVEVGYTSGYTGGYEDDGTMVYGTGWNYTPWYGDYYYGWGWTWGYSYWYVPWYQWWVWRPWWNDRYGLRAAVIDNVYNRWQSGVGVTPHDRVGDAGQNAARRQNFSGYPALYGRFQGATRPAAMVPPGNTLALNPYTRPQTASRAGEIPRGAELLSTVRRSSGSGRDLYASPDGNVYQRRNDGWYRRQTGGKWDFYAPVQGVIERNQAGAARGGQPATAGAGNGYRVAAARNAGAGARLGDRVPNAGGEARRQEVDALERQYYARSIGQMRMQNARSYNTSRAARPARGGGRRR
jgi:hypothetical protein